MTSQPTDPFVSADAEESRAHRAHAALFRIAERHAATDVTRARQVHPP